MPTRRKSSKKRSSTHKRSKSSISGGVAKKAGKKKGVKKSSKKGSKKSSKKVGSKVSADGMSNEENDKRCAKYNGKSKDCRSNKCWYDYNKELCSGLRRKDEM